MMVLEITKKWGTSLKTRFVEALKHFDSLGMDDSPRIYHGIVDAGTGVVMGYVCTQCNWEQHIAIPHLYVRPAFKHRTVLEDIKKLFKQSYIPEVKAQGFTHLMTSCDADDHHTGQLLYDLGFSLQYVCCASLDI